MAINPRNLPMREMPPTWMRVTGMFVIIGSAWLSDWFNRQEAWRLSRFRDKSALYGGRNVDADENNPTWGPKGRYKWNFSEEKHKGW